MIIDKVHRKIFDKLSTKHNIEVDKILEIRQLTFQFIRKEIVAIDYESISTQEEFDKVVRNFNIPSIGKLYANIYNFKRIKDVRQSK